MPYKSLADLPAAARENLPKHAQEVFQKAFNSAWDEYKDPKKRRGKESREEVSFKVAWSAVHHAGYEKGTDKKWHSVRGGSSLEDDSAPLTKQHATERKPSKKASSKTRRAKTEAEAEVLAAEEEYRSKLRSHDRKTKR